MVAETGAGAKPVVAAQGMMEASLKDSGGVERYLAFVAAGIALPILGVSALASGGRPDLFVEMLGILTTFGAVAWAPVAVLAIVPGRRIFGRIRWGLRGSRAMNHAGTALAALAVAGLGALGAAVPAMLLPDRPEGGLLVLAGALLVYGAPGAVLSGLALYWREDRTRG